MCSVHAPANWMLRAGRPITFNDVWSVISLSVVIDWLELKFRLILATQCSRGTKLRFKRLCSTCLMVGRWTSCSTNRWDYGYDGGSEKLKQISDIIPIVKLKKNLIVKSEITHTQQHALTVIWIVFRPGWHTLFKYNGRCEFLFSPRSITNGLAFADTCTLFGQFVFIWRSSWWKHFNCSSKSDLKICRKKLVFFFF